VEEILVTGFRASLQNSISAKQTADTVVEAIYAEDIGKLPDSSIAESLARLPGLAGERRDGRTSGISVRGFNENYVATTMNGRELLGIGDNRGVEYDLYPSEIIAGAIVYKTPDASLMTQGLGGTVELKTLRPLDNDRIISVNGTYEQNGLKSANPDFDDNGHRLAFTKKSSFVLGAIPNGQMPRLMARR
jgi:iron complex outermembrane receptor protein